MPIGISLDAYRFSPVLDMVSRSGYSSPYEACGQMLLVGSYFKSNHHLRKYPTQREGHLLRNRGSLEEDRRKDGIDGHEFSRLWARDACALALSVIHRCQKKLLSSLSIWWSMVSHFWTQLTSTGLTPVNFGGEGVCTAISLQVSSLCYLF